MLHLADQAATITLNESCEFTLVMLLCIATCRPSPKEPLVLRLAAVSALWQPSSVAPLLVCSLTLL